ncbi:MAG: Pr6Pr family membrane protein [Sphingomicrobium sp.]
MTRGETVKRLATLVAIGGWASLGLQLWLIIDTLGPASGTWRFVGFFTILTNIMVATMATGIAVGRGGWLALPVPRMAVTAAILLVGITYWILLAGLWDPKGAQLVADIGLHSVQPLLAAAWWWAMRDGSLAWRDVPKAAIWPALYVAYALARGHLDGWYAYWFLNPREQSLSGMALSIAGLLLAILVVGAALVLGDRTKRAQHRL